MTTSIQVGRATVNPQVATLYAHYLQEVIAAMVAQDFDQSFAVDATFESILPSPHRAVVYQRFVAVFTGDHSNHISQVFFVPREDVVPTNVLERFAGQLPSDHVLARDSAKGGGMNRIRDRLLDALQHGGMQVVDNPVDSGLRLVWLASRVALEVRFDPDNQTLRVEQLTLHVT